MLDYDELRRSSAMAEEREKDLEGGGGGGSIQQALGTLSPQQRFFLALMLFFNVAVLGCLFLVVMDRISLPF